MLLSPRDWLAQWPRRSQLFAVALLLLATIAQNWHVCALSGHASGEHAMFAQAGQNSSHGARKFKVLTNADGSPGPVICACAHDESTGDVAALLAAPAPHSHVTCLALLLQTMPLQAGATFTLAVVPMPRSLYATRARIVPAFAAPFALRGRAPPSPC